MRDYEGGPHVLRDTALVFSDCSRLGCSEVAGTSHRVHRRPYPTIFDSRENLSMISIDYEVAGTI